jgi:L-alanine-DL-glutamate epimerase-like enolase superfamily enzyme
MIDIGQRYSVKRAAPRRRLQSLRLHWMEEPLPPHDFDGCRRLTAAVPLDIAAGEAESERLAFKRLIEKGRIDVVQPDISRAGGLTETRKIAAMAHDANVRLVPHAFKTSILLAASLHLIATLSGTDLLEFTLAESPCVRNCSVNPLAPKVDT